VATTELNDRTNQNSHPAPGNADSGGMIGPYCYGGLPYVMTAGGRIVSLSQPPGDVLPADQGLLEWNFDPATASSTGTLMVNGTVYLQRINIRVPTLITNIWAHLTNLAVTPVSSQSAAGLYNAAGTLLSGSADTGTILSTTAGPISMPLSSPQNVGTGYYWTALMCNASTAAKLAASPNAASFANTNLTAATYRFATGGLTQTSLPSTITPSSNAQATALTFWVGVS